MTKLKTKTGRIYKKAYKRRDGTAAEQETWTVRFQKKDYGTGETDERKARQFLQNLIRNQGVLPKKEETQVAPTSAEPVISMDTVFDLLEANARRKGNKTAFENAGRADLHLRPAFADVSADALTTEHFEDYADQRLSDDAAPATVNKELRLLKRALNLAVNRTPPLILRFPKIEMLPENNVRQGFLGHDEYWRLRECLPDYLVAPFVVAYGTGNRRGELMQVELRDVEMDATPLPQFRLYPDATKNGDGRVIPIFGDMEGVLREQIRMTRRDYPECPWLFHNKGEPILTFYKAWKTATSAAGLKEVMFHDLRRTAVRNLIRSGVPRPVAKKITGHKTDNMFERYDIVDERDLQNAASSMVEYIGIISRKAADITALSA